jgi:hypothetical protein
MFTTSGSYYMTIEHATAGTLYYTSSTITVTVGTSLGSISVTSSSSTPTIYEDFTLTISLTDACGNTFVNSASLTASSSTNIFASSGSLTKTTSTGSTTYVVYSTTTGLNTITITSGSKTGSVQVTLQSPALKFITFSPTVRII